VSEFQGSKVTIIFKLSTCLECSRDLSQSWINLSLDIFPKINILQDLFAKEQNEDQ